MTNYLVTGGAGFIGSHIVTRLVREGHRVRVLDNLSFGHRTNLDHIAADVEFVEGDIRDEAVCRSAVEGCEVIFHQAALASVPLSIERPEEVHAVCATGTLNVLRAARDAGARRVVYAGSSSYYGNSPEMPKREDHPPQCLSPYAAAKLAGEVYCESFAECYHLETVRLRYFNVFGPRQDPNSPYSAVIPLFAAAVVDGRQPLIFGDGSQSRDFVYVENVVDANIRAASTPGVSGRVYNVGCGTSIDLLQLLKEICRVLDRPYDPRFEPPRAGDVKHSWADISAARQDLGYEPVHDWQAGLEPTLDYYGSQQQSGC